MKTDRWRCGSSFARRHPKAGNEAQICLVRYVEDNHVIGAQQPDLGRGPAVPDGVGNQLGCGYE
jgi:hypothetical protein